MTACPLTVALQRVLAAPPQGGLSEALASHVEGCPACRGFLDGWHAGQQQALPWRRLAEPLDQAPFLRRLAAEGLTSPRLPDLPGYTLLAELGRGGMGIVYRARHQISGREVAVKVLPPGAQPAAQERFRREAEAIARLNHPHLMGIIEIGRVGHHPFLALELVRGPNLAQVLAGRPQDPDASARLVVLLARAMHHAHQAGIIHRDLKPANILLQGEGGEDLTQAAVHPDFLATRLRPYAPPRLQPKVTDFGLARSLSVPRGITPPGDLLGTPAYMAPEQARGRPDEVTPALDVYALGVILYECLTGRPPFKADSPSRTLVQVLHNPPPPPRQLRPDLPADLETVVLLCLEKQPARRFPSALELAEDLERYLAGHPVLCAAAPPSPATANKPTGWWSLPWARRAQERG